MKTFFKIGAVLFVIFIQSMFFVLSLSAQQQQELVSYRVFYDELSPYGLWVNYPNYNYAWIPNVEAYFAPYSTAGQWVMTDYGWTWVPVIPGAGCHFITDVGTTMIINHSTLFLKSGILIPHGISKKRHANNFIPTA